MMPIHAVLHTQRGDNALDTARFIIALSNGCRFNLHMSDMGDA